MEQAIRKAAESVEKARSRVEHDPYRPKFHFLPPAQWMNDPNGTIFYKGEYHLFYQFNPYKSKWGNIHWGHAKSKDLVHWEHLPIALAPSRENGEKHCFSGCCVLNQGTPTIFYTSIGRIYTAIKGAEQWSATSNDMITWTKSPYNPIMTDELHNKKVYHWRDPYVWKEKDTWYMVLVGRLGFFERIGRVFLYSSHDLIEWKFLNELCRGTKAEGKGWECPNFFPLGNKWILIVSPYNPVIYSIGTFAQNRFNPGSWKILDHNKTFYATNTLFDDKNRVILFGWIRKGGQGGWNGCLSLPRLLSLKPNGTLFMDTVPELNILRDKHETFNKISLDGTQDLNLTGDMVEILAVFSIEDCDELGFKLIDTKKEYKISYDLVNEHLTVGKKTASTQLLDETRKLILHIFIDKSVLEVFINNRESMTSRFYPKLPNGESLKIIPFTENGQAILETLDFWQLKSITD